MRKKLYSLLNFILLFGLCGCAGGEAAAVQNADAYTEVKDMDYIVVGYSQVGSESDYRIANTQSFMDTFTKEKGYYLLFDDAQNKQENQLKTVRSFILQEVDYIILDPVVETGWESILQEARDAGIPVILSDRSVELEDDSLYTCWVGSNFQEEGENAGKWLADYLKQQGLFILRYNYRCRFGEIDLIARDGEYLVFVEVKYRKDNSSGYSLAAVNPAKQKTICKVARYFLTVEYHNVDIPCRFDVAGIDGDEIHWVKNAFEYIAIL